MKTLEKEEKIEDIKGNGKIRNPEADEINPEDLQAAAEFYDEFMKDPKGFYAGKKLAPNQP